MFIFSAGKFNEALCKVQMPFNTVIMMSNKLYYIFFIFFSSIFSVQAQLVDVSADYNSIGDCIFSAHNNAKTPLFLNVDFADLENTFFPETLPYVKKLDPGFNSLFTLERNLDAGVPRFNYDIKVFKSHPMPDIDLTFPYLLPFNPGEKVRAFDVTSLQGFWGKEEPKSWTATGFFAKPGQTVFSGRKGIVVEICGPVRDGNPQAWYNTWTNAITLLQTDGTIISYKNVRKTENLKLNQVVQAGELLGEIPKGKSELLMVIYHQSLNTDDVRFVIPEFMVNENSRSIVNSVEEYKVVHPDKVRGMEMSKREKRKYLKK